MILYFILESILTEVNFKSISPYGSEWYYNDLEALRNLTRFAIESNETYSRAVFLHSSPLLSPNKNGTRTFVNQSFGMINLDMTKLPRNIPSQVPVNFRSN